MASTEAREQVRLDVIAKFEGIEAIRRAKQEAVGAGQVAVQQNQRVERSGSAVNNTLLAMAGRYAAVGSAVAVAQQSFLGFAKMDFRLRQLQIQTGATWDSVQELIPKFQEWAKASGKSIDEVIEGFDYLRERARLSVPDTIEVFQQVQLGAKATSTNLVDMSKAVGSFMLNMNLTKNQVLPVMDMLTKASKDHMFSVSELAGAIPELSSTMKNWGYTGVDGAARMTAQIALLQKTFGDTNDSADALLRLYRLMGNEQIATAAQLTPEGLIRTLKEAKDRGEDVMTVFAKIIKLGMDRGLQLEMLGKREKDIIIALMGNWDEYRSTIKSVKDSTGDAADAVEKLNKSPQKSVDDLTGAFRNARDALGHFLTSMGTGGVLTGFVNTIEGLATSLDRVSNLLSVNEKAVEKIGAARKKLGLPESDYEREVRERHEKETRSKDIIDIGKELAPTLGKPAGPGVGPVQLAPPAPRPLLAPDSIKLPELPGTQPWMRKRPGAIPELKPEPKLELEPTVVPEAKIEQPTAPPPLRKRTGRLIGTRYVEEAERRRLSESGEQPAPDEPTPDGQPASGGMLQSIREATDPMRLFGPDTSEKANAGGFGRGFARDALKYAPWAMRAGGTTRLTPSPRGGTPTLRADGKFLGHDAPRTPWPTDMPAAHGLPKVTPAPPDIDMSSIRDMRSELERPIKMRVLRDLGETQFRRMSLRREAEREVREARWLSFMDIGAA